MKNRIVLRAWPMTTALLCGLTLLTTACVVEPPTSPKAQVNCQQGTYEDPVSHQCVADPTMVTIVITDRPNNPTCPVYTPDPASVKKGWNYRFRNNATVTHTIMMANLAPNSYFPLTTVAAGQYSSAFSFSDAGTRRYYTTTCPVSSFNNIYGQLIVTAG